MTDKIIIYQVLPRLFGNKTSINEPYGTLKTNGVGKFSDFTTEALNAIKKLGATHIWYTGVIEHATQTDYSAHGIKKDHPAVVKGKAGSPYAIKDYYDVDPDLATVVENRMDEFETLIDRTHKAGLKVIMDFVPKHVARQYGSDNKPKGVKDLGEDDINTISYYRDNNFYYLPNTRFAPQFDLRHGAESEYEETPAKVTGNDCFSASPSIFDWYETVKLNYGVDYMNGHAHDFIPQPDTWLKMRDILLFWAGKHVDGFRCDMAEMVPVAFWDWVIPQIKEQYPSIIFIAETYDPNQYYTYLDRGHFDYLYDKVGLYDTLKAVMRGEQPTSNITNCWQRHPDIEDHLLNFLENHDEQRIASDFFAGDAQKALPAMIVSATLSKAPVMVYFGQELGEKGMDEEGFSGRDGRTTIFDYWSLSTVRRWINGGKMDGKKLTEQEKALQAWYNKLLNTAKNEKAIAEGDFFDLMYCNYGNTNFNSTKQFCFLRKHRNELLIIVANFDENDQDITLNIAEHAFDYLNIEKNKTHNATELFTGRIEKLKLEAESPIPMTVPGNGGVIWKINL